VLLYGLESTEVPVLGGAPGLGAEAFNGCFLGARIVAITYICCAVVLVSSKGFELAGDL